MRLTLVLSAALLPAAALAAPAPTPDGRLARDVVPTFEAVRLVADAEQTRYSGSVHATLHAERGAAAFQLHARELEIGKLALTRGGKPVPARSSVDSTGLLTVTPEQPLEKGEYALDIEFTNDFDTKAASFYRLVTGGRAYTFTQFESADARGAFPCWDEPSFKIPWELTLVVPKQHLALANTPIASETAQGGQKTVVFERTPPLPSYLVAFATGPFDTVAIPGLSVPGRVVTVSGQTALTAEAVRSTPAILRALESYFGRPYPYRKLDLLAVPEYWYGAMENPGAITFVDRILLMDPAASSVAQRERLCSVIAHELAHMWFGDLVTMEWWDDLWLNESFASWMGTKVMDEVHPEFRAGLGSFTGRRRAMTTDARLSTRAIRQPVTASRNLNQLADELAYSKGQAVLRMFERYLGPEAFREGVLLYLDTFEWGNAVGADLWESLSQASGTNVSKAMPTFLEQPGLPLVTVKRLSGGRVRLTQRRFLNAGTAAPDAQLWRIPVVLEYGEGAVVRTQSVMLTKAEQDVKLEYGTTLEWLHPNAGEAGYYRWSLPPEDLQTLATRGRKSMTAGERIGFLDNLAALLDAGEIHADAYLATLGTFADDPEPEVVLGVANALERVRNTFVDEAMRPAFAGYVRRTLGPALERIGEQPRPGESESVPPLRTQLLTMLADDGRDEALLARMETLCREYLSNPAAVPADLREPVVTCGAIRGDSTRFGEYQRRFETAKSPFDRALFLSSLGKFRDPALLDRALRYSMEGPLRPQELFSIPMSATDTEERRQAVFRHFTENYERILSRVPQQYRASLPRYADGCSAERLEAARRFFAEPAHQATGWERQMAKTAESVNDCLGLRSRELETVKRYFQGSAATP